MSVCPSCHHSTSEAGAGFCARCGNPLHDLQPEANPKAVAVGLGALLAAFIAAIVLSLGSGSRSPDRGVRAAPAPKPPQGAPATPGSANAAGAFERGWWKLAAAAFRGRLSLDRAALIPLSHLRLYRASGYSLAYPSGWVVARPDQSMGGYRETVLASADGTAKVSVDYSPGQTIDPASKAAQVEAAASATPGYSRISFGPTRIAGHPAFAWEFTVADAYPRRADLFMATPRGTFALLAYGAQLARARAAARSIAAALVLAARPAV